MKLAKLLSADLDAGASELEISGITADSRKVAAGFVFAALAGSATNGEKFAKDAVTSGAVAVVAGVGSDLDAGVLGVPVICVKDAHRELAMMASKFYPRQPETMVAVTGTAGKTSVASFVRQIWEMDGKKAGMIGTTGVTAPGLVNYASLTTPDPVALHKLLDELAGLGVTHGSMEASSHGLDQRRLDGVRLTAAAFTNLGHDHLDYHTSLEDYLSAKLRLFKELLPKGQPAIIYANDPYTQAATNAARIGKLKVLTVGKRGTFLNLKRIEQEQFRQIGEIMHEGKNYRVILPMAGEFQMANALVAAGLAIATGSDVGKTLAALEHIEGAKGRLELIGKTGNGAPVYVDFAHKPEALENVLQALRPYTTGKLVVLFGCGGDRDKGKRPVMGEIAKRLADKVIVTDDNPRGEVPAEIRREILVAVPDAQEIGDRREAIYQAVASLGEGDCLVVAGKGHEEGQVVGDKVLPFSDQLVVREALSQNGGRATS